MRHTAFSFALVLTPEQEQLARRHAGAARFAYNQGLRLNEAAYAAHQQDPSVKVPYSGFDLINAFNKWKLTEAAGRNTEGQPGLPWRQDVLQQVFEESLVDLGRGIQAFFKARKTNQESKGRSKRRVGFPVYKKKRESDLSFRIRNSANQVRIETDGIVLPKLGTVGVRESTRKVRRVLRQREGEGDQPKLLFATICYRAGRWFCRVNIHARDFHAARRHVASDWSEPVGMDLGLTNMVACANADASFCETYNDAPKPLKQSLAKLRVRNRSLSRKKKPDNNGAHNRIKARRRLARTHKKIANQRQHYLHNLTSRLVKTHAHLVIEDLHIAGMLKNRKLARSIADVGWGIFAQQLAYKSAWYNGRLVVADRFYPSTTTCYRCETKHEMTLADRVYNCLKCGLRICRDLNSGARLAQYSIRKDVGRQAGGGRKYLLGSLASAMATP